MSSTSVGLSQSANWKKSLEAALIELNEAVLPERIVEARSAIHERLKELATQQPCDETMKLLDALIALDDLVRMQARNAT